MKKVINNALDAKHRGWFNASQHNKQQLERKIAGEERKKTINDALDAKHRGWQNASQHNKQQAREELVVREHKSRQRAAARLKQTFKMACKYINGQYIFHQPCSLWNAPCVHGCGYIHLSSSIPGSRKKCCANSCLSSASDNFDKELMMDHDLDELPQFLRQVITSSLDPHTTIQSPWQLPWCANIIRLMESHGVVKVHSTMSVTRIMFDYTRPTTRVTRIMFD